MTMDTTLETPQDNQPATRRAGDRPQREGDRVPEARLKVLRAAGAGAALGPSANPWQDVETQQFFAHRSVVVFALPGAFTPTCSSQHLPRYEELAHALQDNGVDEIVCLAVNDPFVMQAWAREQGVREVTLASDGNCEFTEKMGMAVDKSDLAFGRRSWRYAMLVRDGVIEKLFAEPREPGDPYQVSDADTMLRYLNPQAKPPDRVVVFTRDGCPHCAKARELLDDAGLDYVEIPLDDSVRATAIGAITGRDSVPQVFINGRHVGGAEDLEKALYGPAGRQENVG
jgi:glutaredoxin-like protein